MSMSMTIFHVKCHHYRYNASINKFCDNFSILIGLLISVLFVCLCVLVPNEYESNTVGSDFILQVMTWKWQQNYWFQCSIWFLEMPDKVKKTNATHNQNLLSSSGNINWRASATRFRFAFFIFVWLFF